MTYQCPLCLPRVVLVPVGERDRHNISVHTKQTHSVHIPAGWSSP